jgi:hypothetical protein
VQLKDITLVLFALEREGSSIEPRYRHGLIAMQFVRRWVFLLAMVYSIPILVQFRGGDALNVCFNTVRAKNYDIRYFLYTMIDFEWLHSQYQFVRVVFAALKQLQLCTPHHLPCLWPGGHFVVRFCLLYHEQ